MRSGRFVTSCAAVGVALIGSAVRADIVYTGPTNGSWFDGANWTDATAVPHTTGTLPSSAQTTNINNGTNGGGVVFDPVAQGGATSVTIGRLYISSNNSGPGSADAAFSGQTLQPNVLTVNSGTLTTGDQFHIGRHANGTFNMNGGTINITDFRFTDLGATTATLNYTGGTITVGGSFRLAKGVGSTTLFDVGNSAGGRIQATTGDFVMAEGTTSHATVKFHYQNGGVQTIEAGDELSLRNGAGAAVADRSANLDFALDEAPAIDPDNTLSDLGLFLIGRRTTNVSGGTALFRNADNTAYLNEGDLISATFGSQTYNWMLTYTGNITVDANGAVTSVTGAGTGNDVVLIGQAVPEPAGLALLGVGFAALRRRRR